MSFETWLAQDDLYRTNYLEQLVLQSPSELATGSTSLLSIETPSGHSIESTSLQSIESSLELHHTENHNDVSIPTPSEVPSTYTALSPVSPCLQNPQSPTEFVNSTTEESGYSSAVLSFDNLPSPSLFVDEWAQKEEEKQVASYSCVPKVSEIKPESPTSTPTASEDDLINSEHFDKSSDSSLNQKPETQTTILPKATVTEKPMNPETTTNTSSAVKGENATKPEESFIEIIARAIMGAPNQKMILADLYEHVATKYPYYPASSCAWRNSVRHNLSVNECFIKAGRASSGRGFYWGLHPACVEDFIGGHFNRRQARRKVQAANKRIGRVSQPEVALPNHVEAGYHGGASTSAYNHLTSTPVRQAAYHPHKMNFSVNNSSHWNHRSANACQMVMPERGHPTHTPAPVQYSSTGTWGYQQTANNNTWNYSPSAAEQDHSTYPSSLYSPLSNLAQLGTSPVTPAMSGYYNNQPATWYSQTQASYW